LCIAPKVQVPARTSPVRAGARKNDFIAGANMSQVPSVRRTPTLVETHGIVPALNQEPPVMAGPVAVAQPEPAPPSAAGGTAELLDLVVRVMEAKRDADARLLKANAAIDQLGAEAQRLKAQLGAVMLERETERRAAAEREDKAKHDVANAIQMLREGVR
jgi:hypothetical protein